MIEIKAGKYRLITVDDYESRNEFSCPAGIILGYKNFPESGRSIISVLVRT